MLLDRAVMSAMLAAQGIHGLQGGAGPDFRGQEQLLPEPEQLQPVGFLPQTLRSLPEEELLGGQGAPTPCSQEGSSRGNELILARSHPLMSSCSLGCRSHMAQTQSKPWDAT